MITENLLNLKIHKLSQAQYDKLIAGEIAGQTIDQTALYLTPDTGVNGDVIDTSTFYVIAGQKAGTTLGERATAEGLNTTASGNYSHAEGNGTTASGDASHAGGLGTFASVQAQTAIGKYNNDTDALFVVGDGSSTNDRTNAFEVRGKSDTSSGTAEAFVGSRRIATFAEGSDVTGNEGAFLILDNDGNIILKNILVGGSF